MAYKQGMPGLSVWRLRVPSGQGVNAVPHRDGRDRLDPGAPQHEQEKLREAV